LFDYKKPTTQMLGRWQPWHLGHTELFKKAVAQTGQVAIMVRDVAGIDDDNPFVLNHVVREIVDALHLEGFERNIDYIVQQVPNITDISYGRGVGYTFTQHDLGKKIHEVSATSIRAGMRKNGQLK